MYISAIKIENFRLFGSEKDALYISLTPGLTAIVGENDAGKTAVIDALRFVLGTRDQEPLRLELTDFHCDSNGERATEITIRLVFANLTFSDRCAFAEYLTYLNGVPSEVALVLTWVARRADAEGPARRFIPIEWRTGEKADGPLLDARARFLLQATYLRPLRDAERAMSAGRGSRLSQILQHTKEIKDRGVKFDAKAVPSQDPQTLSVLGLGDYANFLIENSFGVRSSRKKLNDDYLKPLSFNGDPLDARVQISGHRDDGTRLRQLLEKLEVDLGGSELAGGDNGRGLGSNNILFMACELLLLGAEGDGFPLLLIEEPEAHLHPQRQLRLMAFLQEQASKAREDGQCIQIIATTHSPNLASEVCLNNLVLVRDGRAYSLAEGQTKLSKSDYRFLQRFLDVTKANLFFARGVLIVEGDAENLLLPVIAKLIGRDFEKYGVSVVNVGGIGLSRYGRIFLRSEPKIDGEISIPVACVTDLDVMPDCAPSILGKIKEGEKIPALADSKRRWRVKSDFGGDALDKKRSGIRDKANEQHVRTFVADEWTLEYDLAHHGLAKYLHIAIALADADEKINANLTTVKAVREAAELVFEKMTAQSLPKEELCSLIYEPLAGSKRISKATTAQYLSEMLESDVKEGKLTSEALREKLPLYLIDSITYVTEPLASVVSSESESSTSESCGAVPESMLLPEGGDIE